MCYKITDYKIVRLELILIVLLPYMLLQNILKAEEALSEKTFKEDMAYYYKISEKQNLTANDKFYILLRLYEKYRNTQIDLSLLKHEMKKQNPNWIEKQEVPTFQPATATTETLKVSSLVTSPGLTETEKYKISPWDILTINVLPAEELSREVVVRVDGRINLPLVGDIKAKDLTTEELSKTIQKALSIYITEPKVKVSIKYFSRKQIFIMGEINRPGAYEYQEKFKLFDLITQAGGLTQFAGAQFIKVHRGEPRKTITVNFEEILRSGDLTKDFVLEPGDIVEVPRRPKTISVIGEVGFPGIYDWYKGMTVIDAISAARGYSGTARLSGTKILREVSGQGRKVIKVNLSKALAGDMKHNLLLEPGDTIYIPRKPFVGGRWFVETVLPWLTLVSLILVIIAYTK